METTLRVGEIVAPTITIIDVPVAETPAQHVRNALTMLSLIEQMSPATWALNHELGRTQRRAEAALLMLEHDGPPQFAEMHLRRAIETLLEVQLDWQIVPQVPAIMSRLFMAWFPVVATIRAATRGN